MSTDLKLMANEMMSNAVNYMLNQWKSLENFIKDGRVQISSNLCEQRMKPVKLNLKNCQNIEVRMLLKIQPSPFRLRRVAGSTASIQRHTLRTSSST